MFCPNSSDLNIYRIKKSDLKSQNFLYKLDIFATVRVGVSFDMSHERVTDIPEADAVSKAFPQRPGDQFSVMFSLQNITTYFPLEEICSPPTVVVCLQPSVVIQGGIKTVPVGILRRFTDSTLLITVRGKIHQPGINFDVV